MIASRALWADGWKAVVEQPQGDPLTDEMLARQKWELYHVESDFSECDGPRGEASREARRAGRALVDRGRQIQRAAAGLADATADERAQAQHGACRQSLSCIIRAARRSSNTRRSTSRTVRTRSRPTSRFREGGAEGVLLAHGSWFAGYSLYVKDRRLVYVHNHLGLAEYRIASTEELPPGKATLRFRFTRTGEHRGHGALYVGERLIGEGDIPHTVPAVIETSGEGLCCGYDSGLPVTADYRAPFRFTGHIEQVVVEIGDVTGDRRGSAAARGADRSLIIKAGERPWQECFPRCCCRSRACAVVGSRARAALSVAPDQADRAVPAGRQHRYRRAHVQPEARRAAGAAGGDRQPRRRGRRAWDGGRGEVAQRWLHARDRRPRLARDRATVQSQRRLQPAEGPGADQPRDARYRSSSRSIPNRPTIRSRSFSRAPRRSRAS